MNGKDIYEILSKCGTNLSAHGLAAIDHAYSYKNANEAIERPRSKLLKAAKSMSFIICSGYFSSV